MTICNSLSLQSCVVLKIDQILLNKEGGYLAIDWLSVLGKNVLNIFDKLRLQKILF